MRAMMRWWSDVFARLRPTSRSNGVVVRRATAALIRTGNRARERQDWTGAAGAYDAALTAEPLLQHLWIQLGHMEKEAGAPDRATIAYEEAARLHPDSVEPLLRLGHMAKAWRQPIEAAGYFVTALQRDPRNLEATAELVRLLPDRDDVDPALWSAILEVLEIDPEDRISVASGHLPAGATVFDVTDLLAFFGQRRLPTGIQRVQIEVALACLEQASDIHSIFCVYASARRGWIALSHDRFETLCRLARQSDDIHDPAWTGQLERIYRHIAIARTVRFAPATVLINLGTSWADRNYLLDVRLVRVRDRVVYVPLVFDLIPLIGPHWFITSLVRDYRAWFGSLLHSADGCLAISEATRCDLVRASAEWHAPMPAEAVRVVRLDGDFRQDAADPATLGDHALTPASYVLFVSTLEPRKNHVTAFKAWLLLAETLGEAMVPRLVCVGGRGWLNEDVHRMLRESPVLQRKVLILHGIPDDVLATLYAHCLFALYPSHYEGWGLPVSEALSYGKVPAISRVSSLPEAGGPLARYFDPGDPADIAATVRALLDDGDRGRLEAAIRQDYTPRSWRAIALDMVAEARTVASRVNETIPQIAAAGSWTLALAPPDDDGAVPAAAPGEAFRHGRAWSSPGLDGCAIAGDDASILFHWSGPAGAALRLHVAATAHAAEVRIGSDAAATDYRLSSDSTTIITCPMPAEPATIRLPVVPEDGEIIVERIEIVVLARDGDLVA